MPQKNSVKQQKRQEQAAEHRHEGYRLLAWHPVFSSLSRHVSYLESTLCPQDGWAVVTSRGEIHFNELRMGEPEEWAYVYAHCLLHLALGHFTIQKYQQHEWNAACDCYIAKFLEDLRFATPPLEMRGLLVDLTRTGGFTVRSEEQLFDEFCTRGVPAVVFPSGTAGRTAIDMLYRPAPEDKRVKLPDWQADFAKGLETSVSDAVDVAAGSVSVARAMTEAQKARSWFIAKYPLLGALAASYKIIEDPLLCQRMSISVAAVNAQLQELYINPHAHLNQEELRFVMAHELLHVGLRHDARCAGRDFYLWNVACDYVINGWLIEMGVGQMPQLGALYDPELRGESAEAIYDRIATDLRRYRKLSTLRGFELGDMFDDPDWSAKKEGLDLDDFYRTCLSQGLTLHEAQERGYLSAGLIEEIRALHQPPIPWDVELAQWFDHHFAPVEKVRTYARLSRRQAATPDIPRPLWIAEQPEDKRTFGVLIDTSGSMDRTLLAKVLGTIASYSIARDVSAVRVIFCDVAVYDQGYMAPEDIAGSVKVRGRGGTILQPGINLLERAGDFPPKGPILVVTDGKCDPLSIGRDHAFLLPAGHSLPFRHIGPIFWVS